MDCLNFIKKNNKFEFHSLDYEIYKDKGKRIIHWLPKDNNLKVEVLMPDHTLLKGYGEKGISKMSIQQVCQFERFAFVCFNNHKNNVYTFWYGHK